MKKFIRAKSIEQSACSFDVDLGDDYDYNFIESNVVKIFDRMGLTVLGIDFRSVDYPEDTYTQIGVDFEYEDYYNEAEITEDLANFILDQGGEFLGIDFYSIN